MKSARSDVQPLDRAGVIFAAAAVGFAAFFETLWYVAPGLMEARLWSGSAIPVGVVLGIIALFAPVLFAWLCARNDVASDETFDTSRH